MTATWKGERGSRHERGYDYKWKRLRDVFIRANPECQHRGPGCAGAARIVHHVIPVSVKPELRLQRSNLMSVCDACHRQLHGESCPGVVVAVIGAPGSGKTTHIQKHKQPGDLVWDWDDVAGALNMGGHLPAGHLWYMRDMRASLVSRVRAGTIPQTLWVAITSYSEAMRLCDQYVVMDRTQSQCEGSIRSRSLEASVRHRIFGVVQHWFSQWGQYAGAQGTPPVHRKNANTGTTRGDPVSTPLGDLDEGRVPPTQVADLSEVIRSGTARWKVDTSRT